MPVKKPKPPAGKHRLSHRKQLVEKAIAASAEPTPELTEPHDDPADHVPHRLLFALECIDTFGMRYNRTKKAICDKFKVHECTAEKDIQRAYEVLSAAIRNEAPFLADKVTGKLWDVAVKSEAAADYRSCVQALAQLAKIAGAHAPKKVEVTSIEASARLRTADQRQRIKELLEKARAKAKEAGITGIDAPVEPSDDDA